MTQTFKLILQLLELINSIVIIIITIIIYYYYYYQSSQVKVSSEPTLLA